MNPNYELHEKHRQLNDDLVTSLYNRDCDKEEVMNEPLLREIFEQYNKINKI